MLEKPFPFLAIFEKVVPPHSLCHQVNGAMAAKLSLTKGENPEIQKNSLI